MLLEMFQTIECIINEKLRLQLVNEVVIDIFTKKPYAKHLSVLMFGDVNGFPDCGVRKALLKRVKIMLSNEDFAYLRCYWEGEVEKLQNQFLVESAKS